MVKGAIKGSCVFLLVVDEVWEMQLFLMLKLRLG